MATIATAVAQFKADTSGYSEGIRRARKENKDFFDEIRSFAGRGSVLHDALSVALGTGIAAGLGEGSRVIKDMVEGGIKLRDEFNSASGSAADMADQIAAGLPIIGNLYTSMKDVAEVIAGIHDEVEATKDVMKDLDFNRSFMDHVKEVKDAATRQIAAAGRKGDEALQLAYTAPGEQRDLLKAKFDYEDQLHDVRDQMDKKLGDDKDVVKAQENIRQWNSELEQAQQRITEIKAKIDEAMKLPDDPKKEISVRMAAEGYDEQVELAAQKRSAISAANKSIAAEQNIIDQERWAKQMESFREYQAHVHEIRDENARQELQKSAEVNRQQLEQGKEHARQIQELNAETARKYQEGLQHNNETTARNFKDALSGGAKWLGDLLGFNRSSAFEPRFAAADERRFSNEIQGGTDETSAKIGDNTTRLAEDVRWLRQNIAPAIGNAFTAIVDIL